ncbi:MAG TPA: hypothetical protein DCX07_12175, partial [Phycisphaerales bacterium]|nr:hypothetical protein [Phycisphaerales bacterium]
MAVTVLALLPGVSLGDALAWDANGGTGGAWETAANWNPDQTPVAADTLSINAASSSGSPVVISGAAANATSLMLGNAAGNTGYLSIGNNLTLSGAMTVAFKGTAEVTQTSGTVSVGNLGVVTHSSSAASPEHGYYTISAGSISTSTTFNVSTNATGTTAQFHQDGGTITVGTNFMLGSGLTAGSGTGLYEMTAGILTVTGSGDIAYKSAGTQEFRQSGGTVSIGTTLNIGRGHSTGASTGGILVLSDAAQFSVGTNVAVGTGTLTAGPVNGKIKLDGSKTGAGTDMAIGGNLTFGNTQSSSTLIAVIDNDAITLASNMRKIGVTGTATFASTSLLDVAFGAGVTPSAGTWTLLTAATLTDNGLSFAAGVDDDLSDGIGWSFST